MDTLSVKIPTTLFNNSRTQINNYFPQQFTKQKTPKVSSSSSSSNKTNHFIINPPPPLLNSSSQPTTSKTPKLPQPSKKPQESHQNPSTGYAVALLDAARCHHALESVSNDVKRLSRWLRVSSIFSDPCVGNQEKGEIVKAIVRKGNFHKYLSRLVNLLVQKSRNCGVEMVKEVLVEFGRIYDEVMMEEEEEVVVLVSSGLKMETNQVLGVAQRVQSISGAVRVTVRAEEDDEN